MENPESLELGTSSQSTSSVCSAERTTNACFLQQKEEGGRGVNSGICNVGYSPSSATGVAVDVPWSSWCTIPGVSSRQGCLFRYFQRGFLLPWLH